MNDYQKLCYAILIAVRDNNPSTLQALFESLDGNKYIEELQNQSKITSHDIIDAFESLIDSNYIDGFYRKTKGKTAYAINGLTDSGHEVLG